MSRTLYELYQNRVFVLVKTLVTKHDEAADAINAMLRREGYTVGEDPTTWKYYMNMAGEYHQFDIDQLVKKQGVTNPYMVIKVAGNLGPVDAFFTKDIISGPLADPATTNEYRYGSPFYKQLVSRYPEFEQLILGILNPISKDIAINSKNGDILYAGGYVRQYIDPEYTQHIFVPVADTGFDDIGLIESNELSLLYELEDWIKGFLGRWHNRRYVVIGEFYLMCMVSMLYANLPAHINHIRRKYVFTPQVHSYHISEYLESNGRLSTYVPALSRQQAMWLYRNIQRLENNVGKKDTLDELVTNLFNPAGIPLSTYTLKHDIANIEETTVPNVVAVQKVINFSQIGFDGLVRPINAILKKEIPLARDNEQQLPLTEDYIQRGFSITDRSLFNTKVFESAMVDFKNFEPYPLEMVLGSMWIYTASTQTYTGTIYITVPATNERIQLTPLNALILAVYSYYRGYVNITLENIPPVQAVYVPRNNNPPAGLDAKPTLSRIKDFVDVSLLSDAELATLIAGDAVYTHTTSTGFYQEALSVHKRINERLQQCQLVEHAYARGDIEAAMMELYWERVSCDLSNLSYATWFTANGLNLDILTSADYRALHKTLVEESTGILTDGTLSLSDRQRAVLEITKYLMPYNAHFIYSIVDAGVDYFNGKTLRYLPLAVDAVPKVLQNVEVRVDYGVSGNQQYESQITYGGYSYEITTNNTLDLGEYGYTENYITNQECDFTDHVLTPDWDLSVSEFAPVASVSIDDVVYHNNDVWIINGTFSRNLVSADTFTLMVDGVVVTPVVVENTWSYQTPPLQYGEYVIVASLVGNGYTSQATDSIIYEPPQLQASRFVYSGLYPLVMDIDQVGAFSGLGEGSLDVRVVEQPVLEDAVQQNSDLISAEVRMLYITTTAETERVSTAGDLLSTERRSLLISTTADTDSTTVATDLLSTVVSNDLIVTNVDGDQEALSTSADFLSGSRT